MTTEGHRPARTGHSLQQDRALPYEDQLQAYVRRLHESNAQRNGTQEPQRGRDPWLGLAL
jgi:hypothetical protein